MGAGTFFECGCSVETSMFGEREVLRVHPCLEHARDPEIQALLVELAEAIYARQREKPERMVAGE